MAFLTTPSEGTEYALFNTTGRKIKNALWGSRARRYYGSNAAITLAAGGQINLVRLEVGQVVTGGRLYWEALGSGVELNLGDAGDCDRYVGPVNGAVASESQVSAAPASGDCGKFRMTSIGFEVTASTRDVILTNTYAAATSALTAGQIKVVVEVGGE